MIKTRIAVMALAVSLMAAGACFAANPHLGTWKLNEAKSKLVAGMGKNTTVTYAEQKDKIKITVDGVDKDGKPTHSVWVGKFDGNGRITVSADGKSRTVTINATDANGKKVSGKAVYDKA
jgi:lipopolysaccharide export LptBFGC system permease protein LptF